MVGPPGSAAPSADIPADELWAKIASATRPTKLVDFPRNDLAGNPLGQIAIRVLTQGELIIAKAEATRRARKIIAEKFDATEHVEGYAQVYNDECACQLIYLFARRPTNTELPIFPTADSVRQKLTSDECGVLVNQYAVVQNELGPIPAYMGKAEYEAWIARLREGGSAMPLAFLSPGQLRELVMYLVSPSSTSATDKSSAGKPQEETTSNASE